MLYLFVYLLSLKVLIPPYSLCLYVFFLESVCRTAASLSPWHGIYAERIILHGCFIFLVSWMFSFVHSFAGVGVVALVEAGCRVIGEERRMDVEKGCGLVLICGAAVGWNAEWLASGTIRSPLEATSGSKA